MTSAQGAQANATSAAGPGYLGADELLAGSAAVFDIAVPAALIEAGRSGLAGRVQIRPLTVRDLQLISRAARDSDSLAGALMVHAALQTPEQVQALASDYEPRKRPLPNSGEAYQEAMRLLGVSVTSEPSQIKRAYRRLLSRHHPDKIAGSGASPSQVREATEKTRELHNAYTLIRQRRDFR